VLDDSSDDNDEASSTDDDDEKVDGAAWNMEDEDSASGADTDTDTDTDTNTDTDTDIDAIDTAVDSSKQDPLSRGLLTFSHPCCHRGSTAQGGGGHGGELDCST
jgi:hypothetical protein